MRYTRIAYTPRGSATAEHLYVEEPLPSHDLHARRVTVLDDGLCPDELPEDANPVCPDQLPQGVWADYADTSECDGRGDDGRDYADHESAQWFRSLTE
jgi:hypothetical protein